MKFSAEIQKTPAVGSFEVILKTDGLGQCRRRCLLSVIDDLVNHG